MAMKSALKQHRLRAGMSQEQVAKKLGISQTGYQRRETGLVQIKVAELDKLSHIFGVAIPDLIPADANDQEDDVMHYEREYYKLLGKMELMQEMLAKFGPFAHLPQRVVEDRGDQTTPQKKIAGKTKR